MAESRDLSCSTAKLKPTPAQMTATIAAPTYTAGCDQGRSRSNALENFFTARLPQFVAEIIDAPNESSFRCLSVRNKKCKFLYWVNEWCPAAWNFPIQPIGEIDCNPARNMDRVGWFLQLSARAEARALSMGAP